jgi:hypothetical protein
VADAVSPKATPSGWISTWAATESVGSGSPVPTRTTSAESPIKAPTAMGVTLSARNCAGLAGLPGGRGGTACNVNAPVSALPPPLVTSTQ